MYAFLVIRQPLSMNAKYKKTYQDEIKVIFQKQFPDSALVEDELYAAIYYFHKALGSQDTDNITKPILDALKGTAYEDDNLIKFRQSAIIDVRSGAMDVIDLSRMPAELIEDFIGNIDREEHTVYVEIGRLDYRQIQFGYENLDEV